MPPIGRLVAAGAALALLGACAAAGTAQRTALEAAATGATVYVACKALPVHAEPSAFSRVTTTLPFNTAVTVTGVDGLYKPHDATDQIPAWAEIRSAGRTGHVGARCLVTRDMLDRQRTAAARAEEVADAAAAGKGFAENEEDEDLIATRGVAGQATLAASANYGRIDAALAARDGMVSAGDISPFLRRGGLNPPR